MTYRILVLTLCLVGLLGVAFAGDQPTYQTGKILSIEKRSGTQPSGGTDAPLQPNVASYKAVVRVAGTDYTCTFDTMAGLDPSWAEGKEMQLRVQGKTIFVKRANGSTESCFVKSKKPSK